MANRTGITDLEARTLVFATDAINLGRALSRQPSLWPIVEQLSRAAGSVSANHRAMRGARSTREFAAKLIIVNEEIDEAVHWLSIVVTTNRDRSLDPSIGQLLDEGTQLRSIFAKARRTTRERYGTPGRH